MVRGECCILCVMEKHTRAEPPTPSTSRKHICLPFESDEHYDKCVADHRQFREYLNGQIAARPELFPEAVNVGYTFHDQYQSRKLKLTLRRIKLKQNRECKQPARNAEILTVENVQIWTRAAFLFHDSFREDAWCQVRSEFPFQVSHIIR